MPTTRRQASEDSDEKVTPSPPARPLTPGSQKPAYKAAKTPATSKVQLIDISTPASKLRGLQLASSHKGNNKRARQALEPVSPTQEAVDRRKKPRLELEALTAKQQSATDMSTVTVEIEQERKVTTEEIPLEASAPEAPTLNEPEQYQEATEEKVTENVEITENAEAMENAEAIKNAEATVLVIEPVPPAPRRRGRPPKKLAAPLVESELTTKNMEIPTSVTKKETTSSTGALQELADKLEASDTNTDPTEASKALADLVDTITIGQLARSMAALRASKQTRQKIFSCLFIALLDQETAELEEAAA